MVKLETFKNREIFLIWFHHLETVIDKVKLILYKERINVSFELQAAKQSYLTLVRKVIENIIDIDNQEMVFNIWEFEERWHHYGIQRIQFDLCIS